MRTAVRSCAFLFFFFNDTATTEIYTLSLHDALPISAIRCRTSAGPVPRLWEPLAAKHAPPNGRSEEHTSELQSRLHLVCRLLLEKKKNRQETHAPAVHPVHNDADGGALPCRRATMAS